MTAATGPVAPKAPAPEAPEPPPVNCAPAYSKVELYAGDEGHFRPNVEVNGVTLKMIVDTGATLVSISASDAKKLGLKARRDNTVALRTANGVVYASKRALRRVTIQNLTISDVDAILMPETGLGFIGAGETPSLLGLSWLRRIAGYDTSANRMLLRP